MSDPKLDEATARRMGYEGIVAAESLDVGGSVIELCLVAPGQPLSGDQYALIEHQDCDPERPTVGCSCVSSLGADRDKAIEAYLNTRNEIRRSIDPIIAMPMP